MSTTPDQDLTLDLERFHLLTEDLYALLEPLLNNGLNHDFSCGAHFIKGSPRLTSRQRMEYCDCKYRPTYDRFWSAMSTYGLKGTDTDD